MEHPPPVAAMRFERGLFLASQIACEAFLLGVGAYLGIPPWAFVAIVALGLACIPLDRLVFRALREAEQADLARQEAELLERQLAFQQEYEAHLSAEARKAESMQDDIVGQLQRAGEALRDRDLAALESAFGHAVELADAGGRPLCEHRVAAALLACKAREAREAGIEASFDAAVPEGLPFEDVELCAVLSNAADNAIAACGRLPRRQRRMALRAAVRDGFFVAECVNSCTADDARIAVQDGAARVASHVAGRGRGFAARDGASRGDVGEHGGELGQNSRDDPFREHGWGLDIMRGIAERHGGFLHAEVLDGAGDDATGATGATRAAGKAAADAEEGGATNEADGASLGKDAGAASAAPCRFRTTVALGMQASTIRAVQPSV